jgi:predicted DCC family thiol-disulfide oxidoreductase YuxK
MQNTHLVDDAMLHGAIVLFDGVCNLCTGVVQFIIKRDPGGYFRFCSMQSELGRQLMQQHGIDPNAMDTFVLLHNDRYFTKSDAALRIATKLTGAWSWLDLFLVVPRPLRNWCYDLIARNRYKWFGQSESCMLPTRDLMRRFIDQAASSSRERLAEN